MSLILRYTQHMMYLTSQRQILYSGTTIKHKKGFAILCYMHRTASVQRIRVTIYILQKCCCKVNQYVCFFLTALEDELRFALENRPKEDLQRCLCYVHNIPIQSQQEEKMTQKSRLSPDPELQMYHDLKSYNMMRRLRDEFLPSIVASSQLRVYTSNSDIRQGNTKEIRKEHTEGLCNHFYSDMLSMIDALVTRNTQHLDSLTEEVLQHASLCNIYAGLYRIECDEVEKVKNYLSQKETKYPLIVSGGPCTGKTVFLAHCAKQVLL